MILSIKWQVLVFFMAVGLGFLSGLFYDFIRIFRRVLKHSNFWVQIEDITYWISCSILIFLIILYTNNGEIREFFILGIFLGMILYFFTISIVIIKSFVSIINFFKKVFIILFKTFYIPVKMAFKVFGFPIFILLKKISEFFKKVLQKFKFYEKIKLKIKLKEGNFDEKEEL